VLSQYPVTFTGDVSNSNLIELFYVSPSCYANILLLLLSMFETVTW